MEAGGLVHYQGGWSREVGLDALLGAVHTVNVCNNNFHLHKYQPRSRYSNLLKVEGFPQYPESEKGMMQMNTETYYRLLNWGVRLAAGAGSATGAKSTPVGYNRAYVRVGPDVSLTEFNRAWARGENFVTNGPMLFLSAGEGVRPGVDTNLPAGGGRLRLRVEVASDQPLDVVEIVRNGTVIRRFDGAGAKRFSREVDVSMRLSAWIAARCVARDEHLTEEELRPYRRDSNLPERPSRIRFAHTSPIYVFVDGRPIRVAASLNEGLKMMDALESYTKGQASPPYRESMMEAIAVGRRRLQSRLVESGAVPEHPLAAPRVTSLTNPSVVYEVSEKNEVTLQRGDVTAVVATNAALPARGHRAGYNGLASLTHADQPRNVFVPRYAGLNFEHIHDGTTEGLVEKFEPRAFPMELRVIDSHTVEVYQPPTGNWRLESCGRYQLLDDGTVEYTFECIPRGGGYRHDYLGLFWASYIDQPESKSIHFKSLDSRWIEGITPSHGVQSTHAPWTRPDLPPVEADFPLTLVNHPSSHVYTEPWYYGVSRGMALAMLFRARDGVWFAQSPSGGGGENPAWDFQWFVRDFEVGEAYGLVMRLAYVPFESRAALDKAMQKHVAALNPATE